MQTNMFPSEYNKTVDERTNNKIYEARQSHNSRVESINKSRPSSPSEEGGAWGMGIGFFGGFIACSCVCISNDDVGSGVATWIAVAIICTIIGFAIDKIAENSYENNQNNANTRIREEENSLEKEIQKIQSYAQKEKGVYFSEFENNAQKLSVQFAESELAKEVIEWMTNGFCRTIDAADRRSHVEIITVPFVFNVFGNKITCNLGTFDFELKRCRNLNSPLEQTALARAIVSAIQLNIIMKYPKDSTGTEISISITYSYTNEYPATTITYVAPNGNYKAVRSW